MVPIGLFMLIFSDQIYSTCCPRRNSNAGPKGSAGTVDVAPSTPPAGSASGESSAVGHLKNFVHHLTVDEYMLPSRMVLHFHIHQQFAYLPKNYG